MTVARAINLRVRPVQSADLCFPIDGIIGTQSHDLLGKSVAHFDLPKLYTELGAPDVRVMMDNSSSGGKAPRSITHLDRLRYDSEGLDSELLPSMLSALRAEWTKADLDKAVLLRQNAYLTRYSDRMITKVVDTYGHDKLDTIPDLLKRLSRTVRLRRDKLNHAYDGAGIDVVTERYSDSGGSSNAAGSDNLHLHTVSTAHTTTPGAEYLYPAGDNEASFLRAQVNLKMEQLLASRLEEMCRRPETFKNELAALDQEIRKLQVNYMDTMLLPPFAGVVTGVFQHVGDFVRAGQPVLRLENDEAVFLVGTIKHRGLLQINSSISVEATLFDAPGGVSTTVGGVLVAVRGHESADELWDVLIRCMNRAADGSAKLPLNYNFDFKSTTVHVIPA